MIEPATRTNNFCRTPALSSGGVRPSCFRAAVLPYQPVIAAPH